MGLRERKKLKTRAAIIDAASELFDERGFDRTPVADIAARAEISPSTFFTYFPTKEAVVFAEIHEVLKLLEQQMSERSPGEDAIATLRGWVEGLAVDSDGDREMRRRTLVASTPALVEYQLAHVDPEFQRIVARAVAADMDLDATAIAPTMVAAAAAAALRAVEDHHAGGSGDDPGQLLDHAMTFLRGGSEALQAS